MKLPFHLAVTGKSTCPNNAFCFRQLRTIRHVAILNHPDKTIVNWMDYITE